MTAGSSQNDGFDPTRSRRACAAHLPTQSPLPPTATAKNATDDAQLEIDPKLVDLPATLAPETPLPRCLTDAVSGSSRPASPASEIPPAPKLPRFSLPAGRRTQPTDADSAPNSDTYLGLPTDRVLPGSPALVSTFRPKPQLGSCYSMKDTCQEERLYAPKRPRKAKAPTKRRHR